MGPNTQIPGTISSGTISSGATPPPKKTGLFGRKPARVGSRRPASANVVPSVAPAATAPAPGAAPAPAQNPAPTSIPSPAGDIILNPSTPQKQTNRLPIFIAIGVAAVAIAIVVGVLIVNSSKTNKSVLKNETASSYDNTNLEALFDETAPVPFQNGDFYGYKDPKTKETVIRAIYSTVDRFYGQYARVTKNASDGNVNESIINRSGEVVVKNETGSSDAIEYIIDQNIWVVGQDVYDGNMKQLNPNGTVAVYSDYGYSVVTAEDDSRPGYIIDRNGKKVYDCNSSDCYVTVASPISTDGGIYGAVRDNNSYSIINLQTGKTIHSANNSKLAARSNNIFIQRTSNKEEYLFVYKDAIAKTFSTSPIQYNGFDVLKFGEKYYDIASGAESSSPKSEWSGEKVYSLADIVVTTCEKDGTTFYGVSNSAGKELLACEYYGIYPLPETTFRYAQSKDSAPIYVVEEDRAGIYDLSKNTYLSQPGYTYIETYDNSIFATASNDEGDYVCNLLIYNNNNCAKLNTVGEIYAEGNYFANLYVSDNDEVVSDIYYADLTGVSK